MGTLVIILIVIIWVFVGAFINHKRDWYRKYKNHVDSDLRENKIAFSFMFAPIALIIAIVKEMILDDWNND